MSISRVVVLILDVNRYRLLAQIIYDEMLIMKMNPLRVEWFTMFKKRTQKSEVGSSDDSVGYVGDDSDVEVRHAEEIYFNELDRLETEVGTTTIAKLSWMERWLHQGNILRTLTEFEEDTKWIHILSAR